MEGMDRGLTGPKTGLRGFDIVVVVVVGVVGVVAMGV